jgi:protein TonB
MAQWYWRRRLLRRPPAAAQAQWAHQAQAADHEREAALPTAIPKEIVYLREEPVGRLRGGVPGDVPGGVPGGVIGGVLGGVLGGVPTGVVPNVPKPMPQKPYRVGGNIRPPRLIRRVEPVYPQLARQAHIQGSVQIDAIIDTNGRVIEMKVISGHPLLATAALAAVQQWVYEPTYLNDVPVAVQLEVTVNFTLTQ